MNDEHINKLNKILSTQGLTHHLVVTVNGVSTDYIMKDVIFDRPPKIYIEKMYTPRDEQNLIEVLDYDNIQRLEVIGHVKKVLFEWTNDIQEVNSGESDE